MPRCLCAILAVGAALLTACGGDSSPVAPSTVATPTFTLSGKVTESYPTDSSVIGGARVTIDTGPNAGLSAVADADGRYVLGGLKEATLEIHASADGYGTRSGGLVLMADRTMDFQLAPNIRTVSEQFSGTIEPCNAEVWIVCYRHVVNLHHSGPVTGSVTVSGEQTQMEVDFMGQTTGFPWMSLLERTNRGISFAPCTQCPADRYELRIAGRFLRAATFTISLTHPN